MANIFEEFKNKNHQLLKEIDTIKSNLEKDNEMIMPKNVEVKMKTTNENDFKDEIKQQILNLETEAKIAQESIKNAENAIKNINNQIKRLKDILWDKQSKRESSSMYKVLEGDKDSTHIQSNVGVVKVDRDFMDKERAKHLENPNLRGMVTKDELLSFPKVAKNVEPEYNQRTNDYTWKTKADDDIILRYGSREYNGQNRMLTAYSETEYGERQDRGEQGQLRQEINDRNFLRPANENIAGTSLNQTEVKRR